MNFEIIKFISIFQNTVSQIQETGFEILDRFNETLVKNSEESINHATQAISEMLLQVENKTKQDVLDVIENFTYNLGNIAESVIEHAKNATMDVLDESLERIRHEAETFVENIVTNDIFIIMNIFVLITLFSAAGCLFRHLSKGYHCCNQIFEVLSNMILIIATLLAFVWFGLALVWLLRIAVDHKDPLYIIMTIILFLSILYGICHLCYVFKTKILVGGEWVREEITKC